MGDPLLVDLNEPPHALDQLLALEGWQTRPLGATVESSHVVQGTEHTHFVVDPTVRLQKDIRRVKLVVQCPLDIATTLRQRGRGR